MAKINIEDIKPNTHEYRRQQAEAEQKPKIDPIVKREAIVSTKKPLGKRISEKFVEKNAQEMKSWFLFDVLIPGAKKTFLDFLYMIFYGESRRDYSDSGYRSYSSYYGGRKYGDSRSDVDRRRREEEERRGNTDIRNIVLRDREDAQRVVDDLRERIKMDGNVSAAVLADLVDIPTKYTDWDWGWTDPRDIGVRCVGANKYLIDVAEPRYIK